MMVASPKTSIDRMYVVAQSGGLAALDLFEDGSIVPVPGSPYPTGAGTFCVRASPDRRFLYVAPGMGLGFPISLRQTYSPLLEVFRIERNGSLRRAGDPLRLPRLWTPVSMAISNDGRNLYLGVGRGPAGFFLGGVAHFRIGDDGLPRMTDAPIWLGRFNDGAAQPIISPNGRYLYVASVIAKALVRLDIRDDGSLSRPAARTISSGVFPITPAFSLDGRFFYVANEQSRSIAGFHVADDGSLSELSGSPYPTGKIPHNPILSRDGCFIYFANTLSHNITGYEIQPNGDLVALPGSPFASPPGPATLSRSTDGNWLYLVSSPIFKGGSYVVVTSYRIQPDGALARSAHPSVHTGLRFADGPSSVVLPAESL